MKIENLSDLFVDQLQDLYSAEEQIIETLPKMAEKATSPGLRSALNEHLQQTRGQVRRLDQIFDALPNSARKKRKCKGAEGIIDEGKELLKDAKDADTRDAAIIASAQRVEHYEISAYGTARTYAQLLGRPEWARLLAETEDEEKEADRKLNALAEKINIEARAA